MRLLPWFVAPLFLALACSTTSIYQSPNSVQRMTPPPPESHLILPTDYLTADKALEDGLAKSGGSEAALWWTRYAQARALAKDRPEQACERYLEAAGFPGFPLVQVAQLRALETCSPAQLAALPAAPAAPAAPSVAGAIELAREPWLRDLALRSALKQAIAAGDLVNEMRLSSDVAKEERLSSRKVTLLARALELARAQGEVDLAVELHKRLLQAAPRLADAPADQNLAAIAQDYRRVRDFDSAREAYRAIIDGTLPAEEKFRAYDGLRMSFKLERRMDDWVRESRARAGFARACLREQRKRLRGRGLTRAWLDRFYGAQVDLARVLWTQVGPAEALAALDVAFQEIRGRRPMTEALWVRARIEEEAGQNREAVATLARAELESARGGESPALRAKIRWSRAWGLSKIGQVAAASIELDALAEVEGDTAGGSRDRFWSAKWLAALGQKDAAAVRFERLIEQDPLGYYGLLAHRELGRKLPALAPGKATGEDVALPAADRNWLEWLTSLGENDIARRWLDGHGGGGEPSRERLNWYARAEAYGTLFETLGSFSTDQRRRLLIDDPGLLFPRPLRNLVSDAAVKSGVPAELLYSIMRQESSFNPEARSPADAFGLMQLIPSVAEHANARAKVDYRNPEDLFRPEVNVPLGASFLRELLDRWGGQLVLVAASYNASEQAIQGWLKTRFRGDALAFIEEIPYDETRGYVKLVVRNFVFYTRLSAPEREIDFPPDALTVNPSHVGSY